MPPYPLPFHVLRQLDLATLNPLLSRSPHRMPSPNLRLGPSRYIAAEGHGMLPAEERQRARDGRQGAGMCRRREASDAAGGGERGERGDERGERWGRGVGGEREDEGVRGEFRGETRYVRENGGWLAREHGA